MALKSHCIHYAPYYKLYDQVHNMAGTETEKNCNISFALFSFMPCHLGLSLRGKKSQLQFWGPHCYCSKLQTETKIAVQFVLPNLTDFKFMVNSDFQLGPK